MTSKTSLLSLASHVENDSGYINLLVANSGIGGPGVRNLEAGTSISALRESLLSASPEDFTQTFAVNTTAVFYTTAVFLELLGAGNAKANVTQSSQVICTSSIAGFNRKPTAGFAYGASKAATTHLMKALSAYFVPYGIRANVLAPGRTSFSRPLLIDCGY